MKKKIGYGSLSSVLFLFAIIFSFTLNSYTLGDSILALLNLKSWSSNTNGFHYTIIYSGILIIISLAIGNKFPTDIGSIHIPRTKGKKIIFCFITVIVMFLIVLNLKMK